MRRLRRMRQLAIYDVWTLHPELFPESHLLQGKLAPDSNDPAHRIIPVAQVMSVAESIWTIGDTQRFLHRQNQNAHFSSIERQAEQRHTRQLQRSESRSGIAFTLTGHIPKSVHTVLSKSRVPTRPEHLIASPTLNAAPAEETAPTPETLTRSDSKSLLPLQYQLQQQQQQHHPQTPKSSMRRSSTQSSLRLDASLSSPLSPLPLSSPLASRSFEQSTTFLTETNTIDSSDLTPRTPGSSRMHRIPPSSASSSKEMKFEAKEAEFPRPTTSSLLHSVSSPSLMLSSTTSAPLTSLSSTLFVPADLPSMHTPIGRRILSASLLYSPTSQSQLHQSKSTPSLQQMRAQIDSILSKRNRSAAPPELPAVEQLLLTSPLHRSASQSRGFSATPSKYR